MSYIIESYVDPKLSKFIVYPKYFLIRTQKTGNHIKLGEMAPSNKFNDVLRTYSIRLEKEELIYAENSDALDFGEITVASQEISDIHYVGFLDYEIKIENNPFSVVLEFQKVP